MSRVFAAAGRLLRALVALAVLLGFTAGVPWLLTVAAGWPLGWIGWSRPDAVPGLTELYTTVTSPWSDPMILALLASIGWVLWLLFVRDVIVELIEASAGASAARRGKFRAPVERRGPIRWVAAVLVGAIVGAVALDAARAVTGSSAASAAAAAEVAAHRPAVAVASAQPAVPTAARSGPRPALDTATSPVTAVSAAVTAARHNDGDLPAWAKDAPGGVHHVVAGDNLWDIAGHELGNPHRWREIYLLNRGHPQANGYALTDPDEIHVGWILALPARDTAPQSPTTGLPSFALTAQTGPLTVAAGDQHYTVTVHRGDTLWDLAGQWLGDPHRWPEIYHLNADRYDEQGRMRGGDHIEPNWVLTLPADATPPPGAQPAGPPPRNPGTHQDPGTQTGPAPGPSTAPAPSTDPVPSSTATPAPKTSSANPAPSSSASAATPSDPDGVAGPPPRAAGSPPSGSASPTSSPVSPSAGDPAPTRSPDAQPHRPHGVTLSSGSWLDLGLATAIVAAVALVWAHRRRRYTRRPPSPDLLLNDPDVAPMPPVVNQIRRRLRRANSVTVNPSDLQEPDDVDTLDERLPTQALGDDADVDADADVNLLDSDVPDADDEVGASARLDGTGDDPSRAPRPTVPSLAHPLAAVWPPAGLGLTGPGAEAAARGFLAAALAAGGLDAPDERSWVVMPSATAATLLGAGAVALPHTPRLTVTAGLDEALDLLEAQTLHRSRIVYTHEVDTVAELRVADPTEEPLPPILLLADATTRHQRTRIAALLAQGQRLDIHGVLLGAWPDGNTVVVAGDGTTTRANGEGSRHGDHPADIGRLAILTPTETSDLLVTLAESHTGQPQAPAPIELAATVSAQTAATTRPTDQDASPHAQPIEVAADSSIGAANPLDAQTSPAADPVQPGGAIAGASPGTADSDRSSGDGEQTPPTDPAPATLPAESDSADDGHDSAVSAPTTAAHADANADTPADDEGADVAVAGTVEEPETDSASDNSEQAGPGRVEVTVLGAVGIVDVPPGPTLRKKSLEVLVYLAVHDGDAPAEAILDDLLPDAPASKAPGRLYTYVSDLRTIMRRTGGRGTYLIHPNQRYVLNHDAVDVDLWRMRAAIRDADQATDPAERLAALRRAVDTYGGHLAEGADYEWIEPYREAVRLQALDACLALAEALAGNPAEQLTVLDTAIRHNPYTEELYQQAMRARAALGHLDAVRALRRALTRALGEIDAEPSDDTIALADRLVAELQRPSRRPDLRPAPHPGDGAAA